MILNCKDVAEYELDKLKADIENSRAYGVIPHLTIIRVDGDPASAKYVNNKVKKCRERNIESSIVLLPSDVTITNLLATIKSANSDNSITGIILQLPLPKHLHKYEKIALDAINENKDVDCLTTSNIGKLFSGNHFLSPCTPKGIISIFDYHKVDLTGKDVLIINRSMLVGKPLAELMQGRNATVTLAHSKTKDIKSKMKAANIIITAVGIENFITEEDLMLFDIIAKYTEDKFIIDVSINVNKEGKLCGDVYKDNEYINSLKHIYVSTVPGGVGLTTVASLLVNNMKCTMNNVINSK